MLQNMLCNIQCVICSIKRMSDMGKKGYSEKGFFESWKHYDD